jgi:hypothetical protein
MSKHKGLLPEVKFGREATRAKCDGNTAGRPCPQHEPETYAKYAARHRRTDRYKTVVTVPQQRSPGDLPNGWQ